LPAGCRPAEAASLVAARLAHHRPRLRVVEVAVDCAMHRIVAFGVGVVPPGQTTARVCPAAPGGGPTACAHDWS
jgi:hypothetical protein